MTIDQYDVPKTSNCTTIQVIVNACWLYVLFMFPAWSMHVACMYSAVCMYLQCMLHACKIHATCMYHECYMHTASMLVCMPYMHVTCKI